MESLEMILSTAKNEILGLRRENEILWAKVSTMEGLLGLLHAKSGERSVGATPDVVFDIDKQLTELKEKK